jgi:hypothetical protein
MTTSYGEYTFVTLAETKDYLSITSTTHDGRLANLISFACGAVENYIGREVKSNVYTEVFDGGTQSVFVERLPVNNVKQVAEYDGNRYAELVGPAADGGFVNQDWDNSNITAEGNATLKTRIKKFGESSVKFDGAGDYVTINDPNSNNPKFDYETSDFTIEGQFRLNLLNNNKCLYSQVKDSDNFYALRYNSSVGLQFDAYSGGAQVMNVAHGTTTGYAANSNTFMHVAVSRSGTRMRLFRDGSELSGVTTSNSMPTIGTSYNVELGRLNLTDTEDMTGYADELRVSFNKARYTADFTAPKYPFSTDNDTTVLVHFNGTNDSTSFQDDAVRDPDYLWKSDSGKIQRNVTGATEGRQSISVIGTPMWQNYPKAIKVTYNGGYSKVPNDLKVAAMDYIKMLYKQTEANQRFGLQGESAGQFNLAASGWPPHVRRILDMYRIPF